MSVSAVMHRPLREPNPWSFGFRGVCQGAYNKTGGTCVVHQLQADLQRTLQLEAALQRTLGGSDLESHFESIFEEL